MPSSSQLLSRSGLRCPARSSYWPWQARSPGWFVIPLGPVVPLLAIAVSLMILGGATRAQLLGGVAGLAAGAVLFAVNDRFKTHARAPEFAGQER